MVNRIIHHSTFVLILILGFCACQSEKAKKFEQYKQALGKSRHENGLQLLTEGVIDTADSHHFKGLNYFDIDTHYLIKARIQALPPLPIAFKTNTDRSPIYYTSFLLSFAVGDSQCSLVAYSETEKDVKRLFIPFKDANNLKDIYGGGRYLDIEYQGEKDFLLLDFNQAYNPYCHYNHTYSCPLVPEENRLNFAIKAGEKKFHE